MTDFGVLQEGRRRRAREARRRRRRRQRRALEGLLIVLLGAVALLLLMAPRVSGPPSSTPSTAPTHRPVLPGPAQAHPPSAQLTQRAYGVAPAPTLVRARFRLGVRSGLLFDVRSGRVLWMRDSQRELPIASLTKMMTALVVVAHARPQDLALVTRQAVDFSGSGVGLLPLGKRVSVRALLYGLLLPSGNDAAIALAQHVAGSEARFVAMMNLRAQQMDLRCTHFTTVSGIVDQGNRSCASDLALIADAVLSRPELARIVASPRAVLPFPIKGGKLYLYNNNPLLRLAFAGTDGVKTGYTVAAGSCLVATARRGRKWLGVVLLHSQDPPNQAMQLLSAGFAMPGA